MARIKRTLEQRKQYEKEWRERNREKMRVYAKRYRDKYRDVPAHLERKYGITVDDKIKMYSDQQGNCGVCGNPMKYVFDRDCQVEHDHKTGKVRSLTHWYCNVMIGVMEKNPIFPIQIQKYLEFHNRDTIVRTYENNNHKSVTEMITPYS